jgi:hypothetical protein
MRSIDRSGEAVQDQMFGDRPGYAGQTSRLYQKKRRLQTGAFFQNSAERLQVEVHEKLVRMRA